MLDITGNAISVVQTITNASAGFGSYAAVAMQAHPTRDEFVLVTREMLGLPVGYD